MIVLYAGRILCSIPILMKSLLPLLFVAIITPAIAGTPKAAPKATPTAPTTDKGDPLAAQATPQPIGATPKLSWSPNPENDLSKYVVGWGPVAGGSDKFIYPNTADVPITSSPQYVFTKALTGRVYIAVKAVNKAAQESLWSAEVIGDVTTPPGAPNGLKFEDTGLANISTRGRIEKGDNVMIAGFILSSPEEVVVRAIGPSIPGLDTVDKTSIELHDSSGMVVRSNNGWRTGPDAQELTALDLAPSSDAESAMIANLSQGAYTAVIQGGAKDGIALAEVYKVNK